MEFKRADFARAAFRVYEVSAPRRGRANRRPRSGDSRTRSQVYFYFLTENMQRVSSDASGQSTIRCKCVGSCVGFECTKQRITALVTSGRLEDAQTLFESASNDCRTPGPLREQLSTIYEIILSDNRTDRSTTTPTPNSQTGHMQYASDTVLQQENEDNSEQKAPESGMNTRPPELDDKTQTSLFDVLTEPFSCVICLKLLFEPVTTPCGHTFCRSCLGRAIDISDTCPMCRTILHLQDPTHMPVTNTLRDAIQAAFPTEYANRRKELAADTPTSDTVMSRLPLFPLDTVVFPMQRFPMHIFEARYRLMLRRIMQGSRKFGLVAMKRTAEGASVLCEIGSVLEITKIDRFPDGRSVIETIGRERFRIHGHTTVDEYLVARTEVIEDEAPTSPEAMDVARRVRNVVTAMVEKGSRSPAMQNALQRAGNIPTPAEGPSALGLWLAGILVSDGDERQRLLELRDSVTRLNDMMTILEQFQHSCPRRGEGRECTIQ